MAKTAYNKLQEAKKKHCEGKILKSKLNEVAKKYVDHSIKKGMDEKEAKKKAESLVDGSCDISGVKKRKSAVKVGGTGIAAKIKSLKTQIGKLEKAVKGNKAPKKAVGSTKKRKPAVKGAQSKPKRK